MNNEPLEIDLYQLADDSTLRVHRDDGSGWVWRWADWRRTWMDETTSRFAYRCLPLTIANQLGLWIENPVTFTAVWRGDNAPGSVDLHFNAAPDVWSKWINDQFGYGIVTWNTPLLFRTRPSGSRLLVAGPANQFKANAHALTALIETDWLTASFTMNWKIVTPNVPVLFEVGEPLFQAIPLARDVCRDLETATVREGKLADNPEVSRLYHQWSAARNDFLAARPKVSWRPTPGRKNTFRGAIRSDSPPPRHTPRASNRPGSNEAFPRMCIGRKAKERGLSEAVSVENAS